MLTPDHLQPVVLTENGVRVRHISCYTINEDIIHLVIETDEKSHFEDNFGVAGWDEIPQVCLYLDDEDTGTTLSFPGLKGWGVVHVGGGDDVIVVFLREAAFDRDIWLPSILPRREGDKP
jgi:hypothetical protein